MRDWLDSPVRMFLVAAPVWAVLTLLGLDAGWVASLYVLYLFGWLVWFWFFLPAGPHTSSYGQGLRHLEQIRAQERQRSADNRAFHARDRARRGLKP